MFTDTHFHLDHDFYEDYHQVLERAREVGVSLFLVSACSKESIREILMMEDVKDVYFTIGYHPSEADTVTDADLVWLESLLSHKKVVGIGEIGLDYHYGKKNREKQIALFRKQLELAQKYQMPVVIHTRDAMQETYDILKEYSVKGVLHCFSGSVEMAKAFIARGFLLGIGGVVTFTNSKLYQVVDAVSLSSLLLEPDSPYLAPVPYRGSINGPWNIPVIAKKIAEVKGVSTEEVGRITTANACQLFDLQ